MGTVKKALFDTNILVDYLNGLPQARQELLHFEVRLISLVSWMDVLVGCRTAREDAVARRFLEAFEVIPVDPAIAERAVGVRRGNTIRLPDAIIQATAEHHDALLVTRNTRDFPADQPGVRVPYQP